MKFFIILLILAKEHLIIGFIAVFGFGLLGFIFLPKKIKTAQLTIAVIIFLLYFFNIFFGSILVKAYVERYGEKGEGMVVDITETADMYNEQTVMRYDVIIKAENLKTFPAYFFSNDFNIVQSKSSNFYRYPPAGIKFNVKYLKDYPRAFIIFGNDDSEYCRWLNEINKAKEINTLKNKLKMNPEDKELKKKFDSMTDN